MIRKLTLKNVLPNIYTMSQNIRNKEVLMILYLYYISTYYLVSRIIILILGFFNSINWAFFTVEIIFPAYFSTLNITMIFVIKSYFKKIEENIKDTELRKYLYTSFPNKIFFLIFLGIGILLNLEALISERVNLIEYSETIGDFAIILFQIELWQNCFLQPIYFGTIISILATPYTLRRNQNVNDETIYEFQNYFLHSLQYYLFYFILYILLIVLQITSESILLTGIIIITYGICILFVIHLFQRSFRPFKSQKSHLNLTNEEKVNLTREILKLCNICKTWDDFIEKLLLTKPLFIEYFNETYPNFQDLERFFNYNKSDNKIKILMYIFKYYIENDSGCISKKISSDLKITPQTTYRRVKELENDGLIKKLEIENQREFSIIPFNAIQ